jgi:hypothetical protein
VAKSPNPHQLHELLDKLGTFDEGFTGWSDAEIKGIAAPTSITVGDCDLVTLVGTRPAVPLQRLTRHSLR